MMEGLRREQLLREQAETQRVLAEAAKKLEESNRLTEALLKKRAGGDAGSVAGEEAQKPPAKGGLFRGMFQGRGGGQVETPPPQGPETTAEAKETKTFLANLPIKRLVIPGTESDS